MTDPNELSLPGDDPGSAAPADDASSAPGSSPSSDAGSSPSSDAGSSADAPPPSAPAVAPERPHRPSYAFLAAVSIFTLAADLGTKYWAEHKLETPQAFAHPIELVHGKLSFVLARNKGGAWGLLQGTSETVRKPFFLLVSCLAIVFIVSLYRRLAPSQRALRWGLPLVLGGALGNLVDRIRYSWVIDFIDAHLAWGGRDHHWPTFNVADIAICVGVGLMAVDMLGSRKKAPPPVRGDEQPLADAPPGG
jgi:signal peptidase II